MSYNVTFITIIDDKIKSNIIDKFAQIGVFYKKGKFKFQF